MSAKGILNQSSSCKNHLPVSSMSHWVRCGTSQAVQNYWELIVRNLRCNCFTSWDQETDGMNIFKDGDRADVTLCWLAGVNNVSHRSVTRWKGFRSEKKNGCQWSPDAGDWENNLLLPASAPPSAAPVIKSFNYSLCAKEPWNRYGFHRGTKGVSNVPTGPIKEQPRYRLLIQLLSSRLFHKSDIGNCLIKVPVREGEKF